MLKENRVYISQGYDENNQPEVYVFRHLFYAPPGHHLNHKRDNTPFPVSDNLAVFKTRAEAQAAYPDAVVLSPYNDCN